MQRSFLGLLAGLCLVPAAAAGDDTAFVAQRARQLRILARADAPQAVRLSAVAWLGNNIRDPKDSEVMTAVDRAIKDADPRVRAGAVVARGMLAMMSRGPCPVSVVEAILDPEPKVREDAINWSGVYPPKWYPQELAPVLLRCIGSEHQSVRALAVLLLAHLPKHDAAMVQAARALTTDKEFQVRYDAHNALFRMTGKLDDLVPYCLRFYADRHDDSRIQTGKPFGPEQALKNLLTISTGFRLRNLAEERSDDLACYLLKLLDSEDPRLRRATALYLADYYREPNLFQLRLTPKTLFPEFLSGEPAAPAIPKRAPKEPEPRGNPFIVGQGDSETQRQQYEASVKKQLAFRQRLRELGLAKRLRALRDRDAEGLVRGMAAQALRELERREQQDNQP